MFLKAMRSKSNDLGFEEFEQSSDVGESHKSTGVTVVWSPAIRLRVGVPVYEALQRASNTSFLPKQNLPLMKGWPLICTSVSSQLLNCGMQGGVI